MIRVICLGKIKDDSLREVLDDYQKRISKYMQIEVLELADEGYEDINVVLKKERDKIIKIINPKTYIITLEIDGKEFSSLDFAQKIDSIFLNNSNITFIIGGSYGLHSDIKDMAKLKLSFSKMTFPHQLFRVMLLEQIYRSFKLLNNEKYHK